jgi:hypothetical protein
MVRVKEKENFARNTSGQRGTRLNPKLLGPEEDVLSKLKR